PKALLLLCNSLNKGLVLRESLVELWKVLLEAVDVTARCKPCLLHLGENHEKLAHLVGAEAFGKSVGSPHPIGVQLHVAHSRLLILDESGDREGLVPDYFVQELGELRVLVLSAALDLKLRGAAGEELCG